jgi:hypothetical protein
MIMMHGYTNLKFKQGSKRAETAPKGPKTKGHSNLVGKLDSHRSLRILAMERHQKTKAATNTHPRLRTEEREWAKSDTQKANVLADHFANVFKPYNSEMPKEEEREILQALETPGRLDTPVKKFKLNEFCDQTNAFKKSPRK